MRLHLALALLSASPFVVVITQASADIIEIPRMLQGEWYPVGLSYGSPQSASSGVFLNEAGRLRAKPFFKGEVSE